MAYDKKNSPDFCCDAYNKMRRGWEIMRDTVAGTLRLRDCGPEYLPPEPAEKDDAYKYRRLRAVFFNAVDRTLNGLVGMVFRNEPKLADNVPEAIRGREAVEAREAADGQPAVEAQEGVEGHWENIDNAGTHGAVFCKETFTDAMKDGHSAILVDMPPALPEGSTLADEQAAGRRPYWVKYSAEQIINWRTKVENGQTILDLIVFKECGKEPDGEYGEQDVTRYRVLRRGSWELYKEVKGEGGQLEIVLDPDNPGGPITNVKEIPVAFVYGRKIGHMKSQPPLLDLSLINVAHFQKYNDFSIYLHIASRPLLWFRGRDTTKGIQAIGPYTWFDVTGEHGMVDFAETTGAALGAASQDIKDLEERMSILGLSLLVKRTGGPITATEEKNDQVEESSDLATAARSLKDAVERCLTFHAQYLNEKATTGGNAELGAGLDELTLTPEEMTFWSNAVAAGQYSVETLWDVFTAAGKNPADFDKKLEKKRIDEEQKKKAEMGASMLRDFERGGAADDGDN